MQLTRELGVPVVQLSYWKELKSKPRDNGAIT